MTFANPLKYINSACKLYANSEGEGAFSYDEFHLDFFLPVLGRLWQGEAKHPLAISALIQTQIWKLH